MDVMIADTIYWHNHFWGGDDVQISCPSIIRSPFYFYLYNKILASVSLVDKQNRLYIRYIVILFYLLL